MAEPDKKSKVTVKTKRKPRVKAKTNTKSKAKTEPKTETKVEVKSKAEDGNSEKKKTPEEQYAEDRAKYRDSTPRHTLKLEACMDEDTKRLVFHESNQLRIAGNRLTNFLESRVNCLMGQQAYKDLRTQYGKLSDNIAKLTEQIAKSDDASDEDIEKMRKSLEQVVEELDVVKLQMREMQKICGLTWDATRKEMQKIAKDMGLHSVYSLTRAEDVWKGVESSLYRDGEKLSYKRKGDLPVIRAKQIERGIPIHIVKGKLQLSVSLPASREKIQENYARKLDEMEVERAECVPAKPLTQHEKEAVKVKLKRTLREKHKFNLIVKKNDLFAEEELARVIQFLEHPEIEKELVAMWKDGKIPPESFRPCYASLVCENIRGKLRVFCCISIEGNPCPKRKKDGSFRHNWGVGVIGVDLGPQSVETVTVQDVSADNLAERNGHSTFESEAKEKELLRAMERSRRATNPDYYRPDGTIRKGKKKWKYSKHYKKLKKQYHELCRKNALSRKYAINEFVNDCRERADEAHIEPSNVKAMQRRAKSKDKSQNPAAQTPSDKTAETMTTTVQTGALAQAADSAQSPAGDSESKGKQKPGKTQRKNGKMRNRGQGRKKRFGRSILHRNPGYFFAQLKRVFEATGGKFLIVALMFRASQYDHVSDTYTKKKLSERWHRLPDGTLIQRDLYSSFLLMCGDADLSAPDRDLCIKYFDQFMKNHEACLARLDSDNRRICNIKKRPA